jgi:chitin synthase
LDNGASQKSYADQQQPNRPQSAMPLDGPNNRDSLFGIGGARPQSLTRLNGNNNSGGNRMTSRFSSQIYTGDEYKTLFSKLRQAEEMEDKTSPYIIMLVTCYNEGREGLRATFDSLAATDYDDSHKLFFIVVDGLVDSGEGLNGEKLFCTDICIDLLDIEPSSEEPMARSYVAVAEGAKLHNMAKVYAGYYNHQGHKVPAVIVAKCGAPAEQHDSKPGNRGKRDSQLIMMNFISKILFEDRMSELEYELFEKIRQVADVTPDKYELVLAVDADTKVKEDSMRLLSNLFQNDPQVMGACGETCIANPRSTWVSAIQVYEYFVSHHSAKTFESLFGGVTCLPGCFSMYRLKSPKGKDGYWVPILASPDIIEVYSENSVKSKCISTDADKI